MSCCSSILASCRVSLRRGRGNLIAQGCDARVDACRIARTMRAVVGRGARKQERGGQQRKKKKRGEERKGDRRDPCIESQDVFKQAPASEFVRARTHLHTSRHAHAFSGRQANQLTDAPHKEKRRREERRQERPMHRESRRIQAGTSQCVCACAHTHTYQQTCTRLFRQAGKPTHRRTRMQGRLQGFARTRWHIEQLVPGRHPRAYAERSVHRRSHRS